MGRQYEYVFVGDSDYHGFLSYCPGEYIDQVAEEGMNKQRKAAGRKQKADRNLLKLIRKSRNIERMKSRFLEFS
jgi:hypothetical protein